MYIAHFKESIGTFKKGDVYIITQLEVDKLLPFTKAVTIYDWNQIREANHLTKNLLVLRTGGIGDLLALSSLSDQFDLTIVTQEKYLAVFDWFEKRPDVKVFGKPFANVRFPKKIDNVFGRYSRMSQREDDIEIGSHDNWYDVFAQAAGLPHATKYRPQLKKYEGETDDVCLIVPLASHECRVASSIDLVEVCRKYFDHIELVTGNEGWTTAEYLNRLARAKFVVSTDTSAIHFREGIGRPALGLYGAFTTDSRTRGYVYTKSIDIKSPCDIAPCFIQHGFCKNNIDGVAGCLGNKYNSDFISQVSKALKEML
jgi:hypothetical protein